MTKKVTSNVKDNELWRGWLLILASCAGVFSSSVVLPYYSIGALVGPVTEEFGWSRAEFQAAIFFSASLGAATSPVVGWLIERFGARPIGLIGLVGLSIGFFIAALSNGQLWILYLAYAAMALLGAGTIPVTWTRAIATNFFHRRGLALGLTLAGTGICAITIPHYAVWLTEHFGWRVAYIGLGLVPLLFAGPLVIIGFKTPKNQVFSADEIRATKLGLSFKEALRTYRFWVLMISILAAYMAVSGLGTNLFPALTDDGFTRSEAASIVSSDGFSIILGRLLVGYLIDHYWAPGIASGALLLAVVGAATLMQPVGFYVSALAVMLVGLAAGAELDLMAFMTARYFGLLNYAKIYSVLYGALAICSGTAPMLFARVYDVTSSYDFSFLVASILFVVSGLTVLGMGRYPTFSEKSESVA